MWQLTNWAQRIPIKVGVLEKSKPPDTSNDPRPLLFANLPPLERKTAEVVTAPVMAQRFALFLFGLQLEILGEVYLRYCSK